jgi:S-adenosylmethionine synthetase
MHRTFTSESVCAGHPDKICDQISDAIVDRALEIDSHSRLGVEMLVTKGRAVLAGEVTCPQEIDYESITRKIITELGYTNPKLEFSNTSKVDVFIHQQSPDIAQGVDIGGAGDQGMMFGYACQDTPQLMPMPITLAHELVKRIDQVREKGILPYLRPDGKSEITVRYDQGMPVEVTKVILAVPHDPEVSNQTVKTDLYQRIVKPTLANYGFRFPQSKIIVNGTGKWEIGGPASDTGETGRKIMVDTYGSMGRHGGGCFSGKDPTKVDRSGAYACRYLAKNIVAAGLAQHCEVMVAYVIGQREPVDYGVETFGTNEVSDKEILAFMNELLPLDVPTILERLDLRRPIYRQLATYGHFGREGFPWEKVVAK